ncbi:MAG: 2-oxoglutarate and iron-dependent oxygenase domain-containing protein [Polyangiaceae bacterium]
MTPIDPSADVQTANIPTLNLGDLRGDGAARERARAAISEAFGTFGLIYISGHGVDMDDVHRLYDEFLRFTAQEAVAKERMSSGDIWYQRGWTPPNTEKAVIAGGQPDFKECYFAAPVETDPECEIQYPEIYAENRWPEGFDEFARLYLDVGKQVHGVGEQLLEGCAVALGLDHDAFASRIQGGPHVFRLLRYLPLNQAQVDQGILWGEEHTDFNLVTLLPGGRFHDPSGERCPRPDQGSGLYLRTRPSAEHPDGMLIKGTPPAGCLVAQVGQQLEILSGGRFLATPHVITAPRTPGYSRCSAAHFVHLHSYQILKPLDECASEEAIRAYAPPVLAGTYSIKTLVDIGLAPQEALTKLGYRHYGRLARIRERQS